MDTNHVGSINFDANALYLEEDSEHEDDKQQDNELQALISQGGLDGLDDSLLSSSADSSYDDSDNSESSKKPTLNNQNQGNSNLNGDISNKNDMNENKEKMKITSPRNNFENNHLIEAVGEIKNHPVSNENQDESLFTHNLDQSVASNNLHNADTNYLIRNQFSTPSTNQNAPPPQLLQATAIPTIKEDVYYRGQRSNNNSNNQTPLHNENESIPQRQPAGIIQNQHPLNQFPDQTIGIEQPVNNTNTNDVTKYNEHYNQNYVNIQQQHYMPHAKLHSLDRFAVPSSIMPPPAPQSQNHHEHLTNDHELSLNETDNEDDAYNKLGNQYKLTNPSLEPQTPKNNFPMAAYTNNGVQLEFSNDMNENNQKNKKCEETSIIDLNELDEAQLKQLQVEEERQQQEYFNIDHLNRLYCQAQFLYKIRGKKLEEVTNRFTAYQEDMSREIRAMKHRVYLAEKEKESVQTSLDQAHVLCTQYKAETEQSKKISIESQEKFEKLKQANRILEQKITENEEEIENLQVQIGEQQKLDTLERVQEQHEHFIQQMRDQYEKDLMQMRENLNETQNALKEKHEVIRMLTIQLDTAEQNANMAAVERADAINRLTKNLNELQVKYDQDVLIVGYNNKNASATNDPELEMKLKGLQEKCSSLEDQIRGYETLKLSNTVSNVTSDDFHLSRLSNTQINGDGNETMTNTLQRELERALNTIKQKRSEALEYQNEIEKIKGELATANATLNMAKDQHAHDHKESLNNLKNHDAELERLKGLVEELQREKIELSNDLIDKNTKLDEMMEQEEQFQSLKNNLELEIYSKQQHINECEKMIENLHAKNQEALTSINQNQNNQQLINEFEAQIVELKLKVTNREHEIQKTREMYIEVCNDKNNLQDTLKEQYDKEYENKLNSKIESEVRNRLEDQKKALIESWNSERAKLVDDNFKQNETNLNELKVIKDQLIEKEKVYNQLRVEKSDFEVKMSRNELLMNEKCSKLEKIIKESDEFHSTELTQKERELTDLKARHEKESNEKNEKLMNTISTLEDTIADLNNQLASEKQNLSNEIESAIQEKYKSDAQYTELDKKYQMANIKLNECEAKLKESLENRELNMKLDDTEQKLLKANHELNETRSKLSKAEESVREFRDKLEKSNKEFNDFRTKLIETHQTEMNELESRFKINENNLLERHSNDLKLKEEKLARVSELNSEFELKSKEVNKDIADLKQKHELARQEWIQEKSQIVLKKEEEFQKYMEQLEKRFEEDYSTFMQTHRDAIQRTLNEKSVEYSKEKEKLIDMYEKKLADYDANENSLKKKIKELDERRSKLVEASVQTNPMKMLESNHVSDNERINRLLEKISSLEELIGNADAHFEQEVNRLREELDEDYQLKLKYELEREEMNRQHLIHIIEDLKNQLNMNSSETNSLMNDVSDLDLISSASSDQTNKKDVRQKYSKLKVELGIKEKEMENADQAYRTKLNKLEDTHNQNLRQMEAKYQSEINQVKHELNENYKQTSAKAKSDIEKLQILVQKLKKTISDSDKVIDSLKMEMNKNKESHLTEITQLTMSSEREKESLRDKAEQYVHRLSALDKKLEECEISNENLKQEHNNEMNKIQMKMKDMIKSHANSIDMLKKQQHTTKLASLHQINKTCQTETSSRDIELLETFRQKYLETLAKMKSDMMKEFDAQTQRVSERVSRQINEERTIIQEKMHAVLMPKVISILQEFDISHKHIEVKLDELEKELIQITTLKNNTHKLKESNSSNNISAGGSCIFSAGQRSTKSSVLIADEKSTVPTPNKYSDKLTNSTQNLKYSISRLSPRKNIEDSNLQLYSKSASSIRDIQAYPNNQLITNNKISENYDSNEHSCETLKSTLKSPTSSSLSTGYKYTPLRQSWSNLTTMNQLTPYSPRGSATSFTDNDNFNKRFETNGKKLEKVLQEESDRESNYCLSPAIKKKSLSHLSRPLTADSIYGKRTPINDQKQTEKPLSIASTDSLFSNHSSNENVNNKLSEHSERFESDGVYFGNEFDTNADDFSDSSELRTNFYQKYRTQNIRQKKCIRNQHLNNESTRPHSATNLRSTNFKLSNTSLASDNNLNNPIGALYEMSKNYKPIENIGDKGSNNKGTSSSAYSSTTSSTSSRISSSNFDQDDQESKVGSKASLLSGKVKNYDSNSDYDLENETPIKLDSDMNKIERKPILRTAISVINTTSSVKTAPRLSSTTTNNLTNVTTSTQAAFSHNSLPRSRSRSRSHTPTDLLAQTSSSSSYRNNTVSSIRKTIQQNFENNTGVNSPRSKTIGTSGQGSSHYKPLSNSISAAANLAKNQISQKKKAFY